MRSILRAACVGDTWIWAGGVGWWAEGGVGWGARQLLGEAPQCSLRWRSMCRRLAHAVHGRRRAGLRAPERVALAPLALLHADRMDAEDACSSSKGGPASGASSPQASSNTGIRHQASAQRGVARALRSSGGGLQPSESAASPNPHTHTHHHHHLEQRHGVQGGAARQQLQDGQAAPRTSIRLVPAHRLVRQLAGGGAGAAREAARGAAAARGPAIRPAGTTGRASLARGWLLAARRRGGAQPWPHGLPMVPRAQAGHSCRPP